MLRVDIKSSRELQDLVRGLKAAEKGVATAVNRESRKVILPEWQEAVSGRASSGYDARYASTARVAVTSQNVTLSTAKVRGHKFSGGLDMRESWSAFEFGANRNKVTSYQRKNRKTAGSHTVKRKTMQAMPARVKGGRMAGPAAQEMVGRILSLWVQTAIKTLLDNLEKKGG